MPQYAEQADLARFGLPLAATSGLSSDDLDAQLAAASAVADSYITSRGYSTPLATWGDDLRAAVCKIAAWSVLTNLRGVNPEDPGHEAIRQAHIDATYWLRDVAKGVANLAGQYTQTRQKPAVMQIFNDGAADTETRGW